MLSTEFVDNFQLTNVHAIYSKPLFFNGLHITVNFQNNLIKPSGTKVIHRKQYILFIFLSYVAHQL